MLNMDIELEFKRPLVGSQPTEQQNKATPIDNTVQIKRISIALVTVEV